EFLDAKELITLRRTKYEKCNQVGCPDARFGHNLCSVGCSDASGSGRRPDTYLQSQNRLWAKRQVASVGLPHDEYFGGLADRNASPYFLGEQFFVDVPSTACSVVAAEGRIIRASACQAAGQTGCGIRQVAVRVPD